MERKKENKGGNADKYFLKSYGYLVQSSQGKKHLKLLAEKIKQISQVGMYEIIDFEGEVRMKSHPPALTSQYFSWPRSFQKLLSVHGALEFGKKSRKATSKDLWLGKGNFELDQYSTLLDKLRIEEMFFPIKYFSDAWMLHPTRKNKEGEPLLVLVSHSSQNIVKTVQDKVGDLFIKLCLTYAEGQIKHLNRLETIALLPPLNATSKNELREFSNLVGVFDEKLLKLNEKLYAVTQDLKKGLVDTKSIHKIQEEAERVVRIYQKHRIRINAPNTIAEIEVTKKYFVKIQRLLITV